jgi:hypothetical protein
VFLKHRKYPPGEFDIGKDPVAAENYLQLEAEANFHERFRLYQRD